MRASWVRVCPLTQNFETRPHRQRCRCSSRHGLLSTHLRGLLLLAVPKRRRGRFLGAVSMFAFVGGAILIVRATVRWIWGPRHLCMRVVGRIWLLHASSVSCSGGQHNGRKLRSTVRQGRQAEGFRCRGLRLWRRTSCAVRLCRFTWDDDQPPCHGLSLAEVRRHLRDMNSKRTPSGSVADHCRRASQPIEKSRHGNWSGENILVPGYSLQHSYLTSPKLSRN